jgi:hypothetical protein
MIAVRSQRVATHAPLRTGQRMVLPLRSPLWAWLAAGVVMVAYLCADRENQFLGAVGSALLFALVQWLLPACRPVLSAPLCPWNWALFLFFLQLVVMPFSFLTLGPSIGVLPDLPSDLAINMAMAVTCAAFLAFAVTYQCLSRRSASAKEVNPPLQRGPAVESSAPSPFVWLCFGLGVAGFFLAFHKISGFVDYFENPAESTEQAAVASHTLAGVASLFLRPFLGFGLVMLWCKWLDWTRQRKSLRGTLVLTLASMLGVMLSYSTFNYNRGAFVVPLVAMLATLLRRAKWLSYRSVVAASAVLIVVLILAPFWAVYRTDSGGDLLDSPASELFRGRIDLVDTLQMYGSGPQYLGFLLERSGWGRTPYLGSTLLPSLVEPLPVIGRQWRASSGPVIYNEMIYGNSGIEDQIIPFAGEMFLNFHIFGVIAGFCLLAIVADRLQQLFERASNSLEIYVWQYGAVWILFLILGSISVVSQILFYFCWPIYFYFTLKWASHIHSSRDSR